MYKRYTILSEWFRLHFTSETLSFMQLCAGEREPTATVIWHDIINDYVLYLSYFHGILVKPNEKVNIPYI